MPTFYTEYQGAWSDPQTWGKSADNVCGNGTFNDSTGWTLSGCSVTGGVLRFSAAAATAYARYTTGGSTYLQVGRTYTCTYTISALTAGSVRIGLFGTYGTTRTGSGTYTEDIVCGTTGSSHLEFDVVSTLTCDIDDVTVYLKTESTPTDGSDVYIRAGYSILMDSDLSAYTGLLVVTVAGSNGTPGMLYFKNGTNGYLKTRNNGTGQIRGTSGVANFGRILVNADGVWENTTPLDRAYEAVFNIGWNSTGNDSCIDAQYMDLRFYCATPSILYTRSYGTKYDFTASGSTVDIANDTINLGTTPPSANTAVRIISRGGTLPEPLIEEEIYFTYGNSGNTCKLVRISATASTLVNITSTGSGSLALITGHTNTGTAVVNVLDDVTSDPYWSTTSGKNHATFVDVGPSSMDVEYKTFSSIGATSITLNSNVAAAKYPGAPIYLAYRNIRFYMANHPADNSQFINYGTGTHSGVITGFASSTTSGSGSFLSGGYDHLVNINLYNGWDAGLWGCGRASFTGGTGNADKGLLYQCFNSTITGHVAGHSYVVNEGRSNNIDNATIRGCAYALYNTRSSTVDMNFLGGIRAIYLCYHDLSVSGSIRNCSTSGIEWGVGHVLSNLTISGCPVALLDVSTPIRAYNLTLVGNTTDYDTTWEHAVRPFMSFRHNGNANDTRMWGNNFSATHEVSVVPVGKTYSHKITFGGSSLHMKSMEWYIMRPSMGTIRIPVYINNNATGLSSTQRLRWALVDVGADPAVDSSYSYLDVFESEDSDQWQTDTLSYTPVDDRPIILRAWSFRTSGSGYVYSEIMTGSHSPLPAFFRV